MAGLKVAKKALDMAKKARMKRAKDMGFDPKKTWYHGTDQDITEFSPEKFGASTGAESAAQGVWTTDKRKVAQSYADYSATGAKVNNLIKQADAAGDRGDWDKYDELISEAERMESLFSDPKARQVGQNIMPLKTRGNYLKYDAAGESFEGLGEDFNDIIRRAKEEGFDGVEFANLDDAVGLSDALATHRVTFDPANIRSVNAAFDPAKADSPNLLAQIGGISPAAGIAAASLAPTEQAQAATFSPFAASVKPYTAMERLQAGYPQEAIPARFPALGQIANKIDGYQDPTGLLFDTSGTAEYLRRFGEGGTTGQRLGRAFGALPF